MVHVQRSLEPIEREYVYAEGLEELTSIPAGTWRYWASVGQGPPSFRLGRRRVWRLSTVRAWMAEQESRAS
jgi:hypothetical protein